MKDEMKQIGVRIQGLREIYGLSVDHLSNELDIPKDEFIRFENGEMDIPISLLFKLSNKFNVELTALLTGEDPKLHAYSLVRSGKGLDVKRKEGYKYQNLAYNFLHKKAEPFLVRVEPDTAPPTLSTHPGQEFNYCLEGSLLLTLNDHTIVLNEGDSLYFDSSMQHGMQALNDKPAVFLAIIL